MNIQTKANIDDKVFFISGDKLCSDKIHGIAVGVVKDIIEIHYVFLSNIPEIPESEIFKTTAELFGHMENKVKELNAYKTDDSKAKKDK